MRLLEKMIIIRQIQPIDWELFKSLRLTALAEAPYAFDETLDEAKQLPDSGWKAVTECNSGGKESICALAFNTDEPIGMAAGFLDQDDESLAHLVSMWIDPMYRGRGIAETLIRFISDWANIAGATVLTAAVNTHNPRAQAFYRKTGFKSLEEQHPLALDPTQSQLPIRKILRIRERDSRPKQSASKGSTVNTLEKRGDPREICFIPITFAFEDRIYTEFIRNISRRGIYIESDVQILKGRDLTLSYHLPEKEPIKRVGKVMWANSEGMGVQLQ